MAYDVYPSVDGITKAFPPAVRAAIAASPEVTSVIAQAEARAKWLRGELAANSSLDDLFVTGLHYTRTSQVAVTITGKPGDSVFNNPFKVLVEPIAVNNGVYKQTIEAKITGITKTVTMYRTSLGNTWLNWVLDVESQSWDKGQLGIGEDLNSILSSGTRHAARSDISGSILNKPSTFDTNPFSVTVTTLSSTNGIYLQEATQKIAGNSTVRKAYRVSLASVYQDWQDSSSDNNTPRNTEMITILGDSQSEKTASSWDTYAGAKLSGTTLVNHARSGDESNTILFREGVNDIVCSVDGGVIPASGSVNLSTGMYIQYRTNRLLIGGTLAGVAGSVTYVSPGVLRFARSAAGSAVNVSGFVTFESSWGQSGATPTNAHAIIAWFGGNDFNYGLIGAERDTADHVIGNYRTFVEYCYANGYKPIVAGVTNRASAGYGTAGFEQVQRVNRELRRMYPDIFLDVQAYYVEHAIYDAGLTPTAADLLAIERGEIPPQLTTDGIHPIPAAHQAIGEKWIAPWLVAKGYARSTVAQPALPTLTPADKPWSASGSVETGWRDVSAWLPDEVVGSLYINRVGVEVKAILKITELPPAQVSRSLAMDVGFRPAYSEFSELLIAYGNIVPITSFGVNLSGTITLYDPVTPTNGNLAAHFSWFTKDVPPTTLPGVAV